MVDEIKEVVSCLSKEEINVPPEYTSQFTLINTQMVNLHLQVRLLVSELEKKFKIYDEEYQLSNDFRKLVKVRKPEDFKTPPASTPAPDPFDKKE